MVVWVVQEVAGKNVLPAERFGRLKTLMPAHHQIQIDAAAATELIKEKLYDFQDDDHLLAIGDPAAIGIACAIAANKNDGRFKILKWDRQERQYYSVQIDLAV